MKTREEWLTEAVDQLWPLLEAAGAPKVPTMVSVGWPFRSPRKRIGECFPTTSQEAGPKKYAHLFVSPTQKDGVEVLGILVHELIHASDDCKSAHGAAFKRVALAVGLEGKMTATTVGNELFAKLDLIAHDLGPYPHPGLTPRQVKIQSTRMLKLECPACGYIVRTTSKWIEHGYPTCACGEPFVQ
jgi:hypothetical protein